jgi:hypothetical protein
MRSRPPDGPSGQARVPPTYRPVQGRHHQEAALRSERQRLDRLALLAQGLSRSPSPDLPQQDCPVQEPHGQQATARRFRDEKLHRYAEGKESLAGLLSAQHDHGEMVRRYLETLVRHRRCMLRLNTVVGQRVLP